jgi:arylsulfatase A-like enzyme
VGLFAADLVSLRLDFMGFSDAGATARIVREYGTDIVRDQLALLTVMVVVCSLFGLVGAWLVRARSGMQIGRGRLVAWGACAALVGHVLAFVRHLLLYPQLYSEAFYDRGGARRAAMLLLTRYLRPGFIPMVGAALIVALLPLRDHAARWGATGAAWISRVRSIPPSRLRTIGVALLSLALVIVGARLAPALRSRAPVPTRPSVLLIAVDSLRADRVFGPRVRRFPTINMLAARSARFRQAHVTVPRTFPSFVTLLTGRFPHHHGIRHMFPSAEERARIGPSLPAALAAAGWRTAVVSDYAGEIFTRTELGFQTVDAPRFDMHTIVALRGLQIHPNAMPYAAGLAEAAFPFVRALSERADPALLAERADRRLRELASDGRPFFETVFFSTPHFPYAAPWPDYQRFVDPLYEGPFLYDKPPLSPAPVGPEDARHIQGLYDGAVAAVDRQIARLLQTLEETGAAEHTIVVLLADHGENLWEDPRAGMGHGDHLIGERATRVPLLVFDPRHGGERAIASRDIDAIVRDVDLVPTLAALCGIASPLTDGVDLAPLLYHEQDDLGLPAFAETEYWFVPSGPGFGADERMPYPAVTGATELAADGDIYMRPEIEPAVIAAKHRALRLGDWKLVYRPTRAGVSLSLYDLSHDPDERIDVAGRFPERFGELRDRLYGWMLADPAEVRRGDFVVPR